MLHATNHNANSSVMLHRVHLHVAIVSVVSRVYVSFTCVTVSVCHSGGRLSCEQQRTVVTGKRNTASSEMPISSAVACL